MRVIVAILLGVVWWSSMAIAVSAGEPLSFRAGSWSEIVAAHAKRPTIVHLWGLSCGPCLAELPEWRALLRSEAGFDLVLVNADRIRERPGAAMQRLAQAGLEDVESWAFADAHVERLRFEIDPDWQGELPRTILLAPDGSVSAFSGSADFAALKAWIAKAGGP